MGFLRGQGLRVMQRGEIEFILLYCLLESSEKTGVGPGKPQLLFSFLIPSGYTVIPLCGAGRKRLGNGAFKIFCALTHYQPLFHLFHFLFPLWATFLAPIGKPRVSVTDLAWVL